jgi:hypothetical protein
MRIWSYLLLVMGIVGAPVAAQAQFTPSDVQKLEEEFHIAQVPPNLAAIKASNPTAYAELLMRRFYPRIQDMCISRGVPIDNEIFGKAMKLLDIGIGASNVLNPDVDNELQGLQKAYQVRIDAALNDPSKLAKIPQLCQLVTDQVLRPLAFADIQSPYQSYQDLAQLEANSPELAEARELHPQDVQRMEEGYGGTAAGQLCANAGFPFSSELMDRLKAMTISAEGTIQNDKAAGEAYALMSGVMKISMSGSVNQTGCQTSEASVEQVVDSEMQTQQSEQKPF